MKTLRRDISVSAPQFIESEQETVFELAFSSENPYTREYCTEDGVIELQEILVHDENSVDLSLLNDKAAVLFNHNFDNHIGCIVRDSARIDADRVGRCLVQFSKVGTLANEISAKVREGTMEKVSVGYNVLDYKPDYTAGVMYVTKWQPYEVSLVSCPCDSSVGIGRSLNKDVIDLTDGEIMEQETEKLEQDVPVEEDIAEQEISEELPEEETRSEEINKENEDEESQSDLIEEEKIEEEDPFVRPQEDIEEMRAIANRLDIPEEELEKAILDEDVTVETFKQRALNTNTKSIIKEKIMTDTIHNLETRFSLTNAVRSLAEGKPLQGAEAEYSQEQAHKNLQRGRAQRANSVYIPASALRASQNMQSLKPVVGEDIRHDCFADMIVAQSVLGKLGVRTINATGPVSLPSLSSSAVESFGFVAEGQSAGEGTLKFAAQPMTLRTFNGVIPVTRQAAITLPNIGAIVGEHMIKQSKVAIEKAVLSNADNANARAGVAKLLKDASKVKQIDWTHAEFLKLIAEMTDKGYAEEDMAFVTRGVVKAELAATLKDAGVPGFLVEGDKLVNRPIYGTGVVAEDTMIVGDWSSLVIADFGALELDLDDSTGRAAGNLFFRVWADLDWAIMDHSALTLVEKKLPSRAK